MDTRDFIYSAPPETFMEYQQLREKILEETYPGQKEINRLNDTYQKISEFIETEYDLKTHFAGSASRNTCMKGDKDIDVFILFPEGTEEETLEEKGLEIGKKVFKQFNGSFHVDYAEHPYVKGEIGEFEVEIVPCIDTDPEDITSSVDRTPHHSLWVDNNLNNEQRKDVVLLKKFLTANNIYGSSLKTRGFSGYLCEILISHYGSFQKLMQKAEDMDKKQVIDPANHHENHLPEKLENKFKNESLIVIDPVDPERNVASVLSEKNYAKFIYLAWKFNKDPSLNFFREKVKSFSRMEIKKELEKRSEFLVLQFSAPEEVDDIVYPQMRKALRRLEKELRRNDFRIYESGFYVGDTVKVFLELDEKLPEVREREGPKPFHGVEHLEQFESKYRNIYIEDGKLKAKTGREFSDAKNLLKSFLSDNLEEKGIPGKIAENIRSYRFIDPLEGGDEWLNYLGEKLHVKHNGRS
ncbi:MAG: CCA tRNA nucleotidyltransferase [Candidatus Nanohaloarchaea archaeon]